MKHPIQTLKEMWASAMSADHIQSEWDSRDFALDPAPMVPGMNNYPMMVVNARSADALATLEWVNVPMWASVGSHAYMLSSRRIQQHS